MDSSSIKKSLKVPSYICGLLRIFNTWNLYNISFFRPNCLEGCSFIKCECTKWSKTMFVIYVEKVLLRAVFYQPIWKVPILKSKNLFVTSVVQNSIPWQLYTVWQYGLWSFQTGGTKLEWFLPKNQHTQRKLLNFEFLVLD